MIVPFLIIWGTSIPFDKVISLHSLQQSTRGSLFSTFSPSLVISCLSHNSHSDRCEGENLSWFWFAFLWWLVTLSVSYVPDRRECQRVKSSHCLLWKSVSLVPLPICKLDCLGFLLLSHMVLYIFWILTLIQIYDLPTFSPIYVSFSFW